MSMRKYLTKTSFGVVTFFLLLIFTTEEARAVLDLQVHEELTVYEKPSVKSRKITNLNRGDKVVISPNTYGLFRKVLVSFEGQRRGGYILSSDISRSTISERIDGNLIGKRIYTNKYSLGLAFVGTYMQQGARNFSTSSQDVYEISSLESTTFFFSAFMDIPWSRKMMLRPYVSFRSTNFGGEAKLKGAISALRPAQLTIEQNFVGAGVLAKLYSDPLDLFWWGGGFEVSKGNQSKVVIDDGIPLSVEDSGPSFYVLAYGALGWDIPAPGSIWIVPDLRLGLIPNSDPKILFLEAFLALSYSF